MPEIRMPIGAGTPPTPATNEVSLYAKPDKRFYMQDDTGAEVKILTNESTLTDLTVNLPLTSTGGSSPTISINAATSVAAGSMSGVDKAKLDNATNTSSTNTLVLRDGSGNFAAGTITADLVGNASTCTTIPTLSGAITNVGNLTTLGTGVIANANIAAGADIDLTKLAQNPLDRSLHTGTQDATTTLTNFGSAVDTHLTANAPIVNGMINSGAAIEISKLEVDPRNRSTHTGTQLHTTISDFDTEVNSLVAAYLLANPITNAEVDASAGITLDKLAVDPLDRTNHTGSQLASTISDFATAVDSALTGGDGIDITSGVVSVEGTADRITVGGGTVDIASTYTGQSSITTLGFVTSGAWNANEVAIAYGGTGANTASEAVHNLSFVTSETGSVTLDDADSIVIVNTGTGPTTVALPTADRPYRFTIKRVGGNTLTVNPDLIETIDGASTLDLTTDYDFVTVVSDSAGAWYVVASS